MMREGLVTLWQSRGGGLFGLGYVVTFVVLEVLEIPEFFRDLLALFAGDGTLPGSLFVLAIDFVVDTFLNMVYAFIWPALLMRSLGGYGVFLVAVGFASFDRVLRPLVERFVPELKAPEPEAPEPKENEPEPEQIEP